MITVGYLKKVLADIDDSALAYAYEGEVVGIIIVSSKKSDGIFNDNIIVINANEDDVIQDG